MVRENRERERERSFVCQMPIKWEGREMSQPEMLCWSDESPDLYGGYSGKIGDLTCSSTRDPKQLYTPPSCMDHV